MIGSSSGEPSDVAVSSIDVADRARTTDSLEVIVNLNATSPQAVTVTLFRDGDAVGAARAHLDPNAVVVWFSAQTSLHNPETSPSKAYESMAAGALIGTGAPVAADPPLLAPSRLVLVGVRDASD